MKKNILIIGNLGYVGSKLTEMIDYKKYFVYGLDIGLFKNQTIYKNFKEKNVKQYYCDVRNLNKEILKNKHIIIYLAAISNDPMGQKFKKITHDINYKTTIKIAKLAKKLGTECFIFASSCSVYGSFGSKSKKENFKLNPLTVYAKSKIYSEKALKKISSRKFKIFSLRFATACGESSRLRLDLVLNDFVYSALYNKEIKILSDGKPYRPLIDVRDMSRAIIFCFSYEKIKKKYLCINTGSNSWNFTILELAKKVSKVLGNVPLKVMSENPSDKRSYKVNFDAFKKIAPNNYPKMKIDDTIRNLKKKMMLKKFKKDELIRLNILNKRIKEKFIKL